MRDRSPRALERPPTTTTAGATTRPSAKRPRSAGRIRDDPIGGPPRTCAEPARLERERPLADVDERAEQDGRRRAGRARGPAARTIRPMPARAPAARRGSACAAACIRGTSWTADRTTNAIRWLTPRATSDSSRSSARVVNRNRTEATKTTSSRPAETSPKVSPSRVSANGPSVREDIAAARVEERVDDQDRRDQDRRDAQGPDESDRKSGRGRRRRAAATASGQEADRRQQERGDQENGRPGAWSAGCAGGASSIPRRSSRTRRPGGHSATVSFAAAEHRPDGHRQRGQDHEHDRVADRLVERVAGQALGERRLEDARGRASGRARRGRPCPPPVTPPKTPAAIGAEMSGRDEAGRQPPTQTGKSRACSPRRAQRTTSQPDEERRRQRPRRAPSGSDSARPVRSAPPRSGSGGPSPVTAVDRGEVAVGPNSRRKHGEDEGRRRDRRGADQVRPDARVVALELEDGPPADHADERRRRDDREPVTTNRICERPGRPDRRRGRPSPGRRAARRPAATTPSARARKPPTRASSDRSWKTPRLAQNPAIRPIDGRDRCEERGRRAGAARDRQDRPDEVRQQAGQGARPRSGERADEDRPDRVEVDRQAQRDDHRADGDVDRDRDRHQAQGRGREVARAPRDDGAGADRDHDRRAR